jgi:hypothetical protein
VKFVRNCKLRGSTNWLGRSSLECLSNAIDIFFRGPWFFRRFYTQQITCTPQFVVLENRMLFPVGGWRPYCVLKRRWTVVRDCNFARHNMLWTWTCGVDIVTELAETHQLAHAHKPSMMKKNFFPSFPFRWHIPDFRDTHFLFGYLSCGHSV